MHPALSPLLLALGASLLAPTCAGAPVSPVAPAADDRQPLRFRDDETFKIVAFTDVQIGSFATDVCKNVAPELGPCDARNTTELMGQILDAEAPDLVVLTGDIVASGATVETYREILSVMEGRGVPWASTYGNHDGDSLSTAELGELERSLRPLSQLEVSPPGVFGVSNYVRTVGSSADAGVAAASLFFFDTHREDVSGTGIGGWDWIRPSQIAFYRAESAAAGAVPALAFYHLPIPEYETVLADPDAYACWGEQLQSVTAPRVNSGLFAAFAEQGDVMGHFVGHEHAVWSACKYFGQKLLFNQLTGYTAGAGTEPNYPRGARVIVLTEGERDFSTYIRLADGTIVDQPAGW